MSKLTIIANIKANSDKIDLVKAELEKLIAITRAEAGCVQYDLLQDNDNNRLSVDAYIIKIGSITGAPVSSGEHF